MTGICLVFIITTCDRRCPALQIFPRGAAITEQGQYVGTAFIAASILRCWVTNDMGPDWRAGTLYSVMTALIGTTWSASNISGSSCPCPILHSILGPVNTSHTLLLRWCAWGSVLTRYWRVLGSSDPHCHDVDANTHIQERDASCKYQAGLIYENTVTRCAVYSRYVKGCSSRRSTARRFWCIFTCTIEICSKNAVLPGHPLHLPHSITRKASGWPLICSFSHKILLDWGRGIVVGIVATRSCVESDMLGGPAAGWPIPYICHVLLVASRGASSHGAWTADCGECQD